MPRPGLRGPFREATACERQETRRPLRSRSGRRARLLVGNPCEVLWHALSVSRSSSTRPRGRAPQRRRAVAVEPRARRVGQVGRFAVEIAGLARGSCSRTLRPRRRRDVPGRARSGVPASRRLEYRSAESHGHRNQSRSRRVHTPMGPLKSCTRVTRWTSRLESGWLPGNSPHVRSTGPANVRSCSSPPNNALSFQSESTPGSTGRKENSVVMSATLLRLRHAVNLAEGSARIRGVQRA